MDARAQQRHVEKFLHDKIYLCQLPLNLAVGQQYGGT